MIEITVGECDRVADDVFDDAFHVGVGGCGVVGVGVGCLRVAVAPLFALGDCRLKLGDDKILQVDNFCLFGVRYQI